MKWIELKMVCASLIPLLQQMTVEGIVRHVSRYKSSGSSNQWLQRQWKDPFVKQAKTDNWRCRSAYKLLQIEEKYNLLKPGHVVVDCGAAPGSWTQVAVQKVGADKGQGLVIGIDLLPIRPIDGAIVMDQSNFTTPETQRRLLSILGTRKADLVMSDMAPNASGNRQLDHEILIDMCCSVLRFSRAVLQENGTILCKLWQGALRQSFERSVSEYFQKVKIVKPEASRSDSAEIYILGQGFRTKDTR